MRLFALVLIPFLCACSSMGVSIPFVSRDKKNVVITPWVYEAGFHEYQCGIQVLMFLF
jgi:hypothetical protein